MDVRDIIFVYLVVYVGARNKASICRENDRYALPNDSRLKLNP